MEALPVIEETQYLLALSSIAHIGPITTRSLIQKYGSAREVFNQPKSALKRIIGLHKEAVECIHKKQTLSLAASEINYCLKHNIQLIPYTSSKYPKRLKMHADSPVVLFYKGKGSLNTRRNIGIVGTRTPTTWGKNICEQIVEQLSEYDVTIYSGLAHGIDVAAHHQCLKNNIPTIGVVGHGLGIIYPSGHYSTAERMLERGGILSSFLHDTGPDRVNFPKRNRVLAGMLDALVVVETKNKGGSMLTVNYAREYDRTVYAVPGRLGDPFSVGCNRLIKEGKARLLENASDIARLFEWESSSIKQPLAYQQSLIDSLSPMESNVLKVLKSEEALKLDKISYETSIKVNQLSGILLDLEFKKLVKSIPGSRYVKMPGTTYAQVAEPEVIYQK